jgi:hypothetical protein
VTSIDYGDEILRCSKINWFIGQTKQHHLPSESKKSREIRESSESSGVREISEIGGSREKSESSTIFDRGEKRTECSERSKSRSKSRSESSKAVRAANLGACRDYRCDFYYDCCVYP